MNQNDAETCRLCNQECKQPSHVSVIFCPHFQHSPEQVEMKLKVSSKQ